MYIVYNSVFDADSVCVCVCVCVCVHVCQGGNRQSDGAGAGAEVLLFRGGGQSELTQERAAGHLQGTQ